MLHHDYVVNPLVVDAVVVVVVVLFPRMMAYDSHSWNGSMTMLLRIDPAVVSYQKQ
jgi:hypothetical protein